MFSEASYELSLWGVEAWAGMDAWMPTTVETEILTQALYSSTNANDTVPANESKGIKNDRRSSSSNKKSTISEVKKGRPSKRRSRAANKAPITILNADPENFRAMVQQVTGFPMSNTSGDVPWTPASSFQVSKLGSSQHRTSYRNSYDNANIHGLPILDTSAVLVQKRSPVKEKSSSCTSADNSSSSYMSSPVSSCSVLPSIGEMLLIDADVGPL